MQTKLISVASAVIKNGNKILLLRRSLSNKYFANHWQLPEGKIEPSESAEEAILREINEELGVKGQIKEYFGTKTACKTIANQVHLVKRTIFTVTLSGAINLSLEHTELRWVNIQTNIAPLYPGTKPILLMLMPAHEYTSTNR